MERMTEEANIKNLEENPLLPPNTSLRSNVTPVNEDCGPSGSKEEPLLRKEPINDQPSSPESNSMEEHFSWLIDFLEEPNTPVKICAHHHQLHSNLQNYALEAWRQRAIMPFPLWGSHEFDRYNHGRHYFPNPNWFVRPNYTEWRPEHNIRMYSNRLHPSPSGLKLREHEAFESNAAKNPEQEESAEEIKSEPKNKDVSQTDSKQDKLQIPQRSRVRKLQYITELENCIQALQAEGLEVLAQLQYLDKQNFILSFENQALKQRLNSMLQEQFIKCIQNDMLEREVHRLHQLFQQQRAPKPFTIPRSY